MGSRLAGGSALSAAIERHPTRAVRRLALVAADGAAFRAALRDLVSATEQEGIVTDLLARTAIPMPVETFRMLPTMRPYAIRDRGAREVGGRDEWGSPDARGLLRDDNTLVKRLPAPLPIAGGAFDGCRIGTGWTACHAWRRMPDGEMASTDPWLYTFVPVVAWVPSALAPYTDREGSEPQDYLKDLAEWFRGAGSETAVREWNTSGWRRLPPRTGGGATAPRQTFAHDARLVRRRARSIRLVAEALDRVGRGQDPGRRVVCTRYANGLPQVDSHTAVALASELMRYAQAVDEAVAA